ncbi:MAG: LytTR family transcriptional regulator DNA-binding domain-containing protein [Bacteroidales bacterium]|nr:LytTR family transcriptional regulator DNA-binding domain-containing protein [Bacteroidales bacterium]
MKKGIIIVAYWLAAIFLTALLLTSLDYDMWQAVLMSLSFLPAALALSFFLPKVERSKRRIWDTIYIILGVMLMTFLLIYVWQWLFISLEKLERRSVWSIPSMLVNPVFVAAVLAILAYGYYLLARWLEKKYPTERPVTFTSDYRKVSLNKQDILYVESHDSEVWIITRDGQQYRNRNGISQWENLLGAGFLRVHRSFLVNTADAVLTDPDLIIIGGHAIPVSRKYKDAVKAVLSAPQENP